MSVIKPILVIDVSPLWEIQYTGIANVVYELTKRFICNVENHFDIIFSVLSKQVDTNIIEKCIIDRCGRHLQNSFNENKGIKEIKFNDFMNTEGRQAFGLFLHRKPNQRVFRKDAYLFYDFSVLLTPECHERSTVQYFTENLSKQILNTDLFFCISESTAKDLQWIFNVPKNKIVVSLLGNNVDTNLADLARKKIAGREIEPYFVTLGTIEPRKNIGIILAWISQNRKVLDKYRFVFAGRQGWGKQFQEYIAEYGLDHEFTSGRIVHYGYVDEAQKAALLIGAKAVFYPSLFEGFGLPVLEAMELGVPVIASCSTSIPEVLGDAGYYFDPYSLDSFDSAFKNFIHDDITGKIEEIRYAAKNRAQTFSYDKTYSVIYKALVSHFIIESLVINKNYDHKNDQLELKGFSESENDFCWTDCQQAHIEFKWDNVIDLSEELNFTFDTLGLQTIVVKLNNYEVFNDQIDVQVHTIKCKIGKYLLKGKNILSFDLPNAMQPDHNDTRTLALAFRELKIIVNKSIVDKQDAINLQVEKISTEFEDVMNSAKNSTSKSKKYNRKKKR